MTMAVEPRFHKGDRAWFRFDDADVMVEVIEEPYLVGVSGLLIRIRQPLDGAETIDLTVPESELRPVTDAA